MRPVELPPTSENILGTFRADRLQRKGYIYRFLTLLNSLEGGYTIALDGGWGSGKTFFVKQVKMLLDGVEGALDADEASQVKKEIEEKAGRALKPQLAVYYDAWIHDNDDDPIVSLLYSILQNVSGLNHRPFEKGLGEECVKKVVDIITQIAGIISPKVHEIIKKCKELYEKNKAELQDLGETSEAKELFSHIRREEKLREEVQKFFTVLLEESGKKYERLVIFVDELDRCKPSYAIKLLERIKHYFTDERVTFVLSVNISELQGMIKFCYGLEYNASRYLDRFFDLRTSLPDIDIDLYLRMKTTDNRYTEYFIPVIKMFRLRLREIMKFFDVMDILYGRFRLEASYNDFMSLGQDSYPFCLAFIFPVMVGLKFTNQAAYDAFIAGENPQPLLDLLKYPEECLALAKYFPSKGEATNPDTKDEDAKVPTSLEEQLKETYDCLFNMDFSFTPCVAKGRILIDRLLREFVFQGITFLADPANFR